MVTVEHVAASKDKKTTKAILNGTIPAQSLNVDKPSHKKITGTNFDHVDLQTTNNRVRELRQLALAMRLARVFEPPVEEIFMLDE